jgi:hypothetical protein
MRLGSRDEGDGGQHDKVSEPGPAGVAPSSVDGPLGNRRAPATDQRRRRVLPRGPLHTEPALRRRGLGGGLGCRNGEGPAGWGGGDGGRGADDEISHGWGFPFEVLRDVFPAHKERDRTGRPPVSADQWIDRMKSAVLQSVDTAPAERPA